MMKTNKPLSVVIAVILLVILGALLSNKVENYMTVKVKRHLAEHGIETVAIVTEKNPFIGTVKNEDKQTFHFSLNSKLKSENSAFGEVNYQYRDHHGKLRAGFDTVTKQEYDRYKQGDQIKIMHFNRFPAFSRMKINVDKP